MSSRTVIVGGGMAGGEVAAALRAEGYAGEIVLVGDEPHLPYHRPPLSKAYLKGEVDQDQLLLRPETFYEKNRIRTLLGRRATGLDTLRQMVALDDGIELTYDHLVLATGGTARRLEDPSLAGASNVFYLRNIADVDAMRSAFAPGAHLTVVGGGYIGLEVASVARKLGMRVTVLEVAARLLARVAGEQLSEFFRRVHSEEGVEVRLGARIEGFEQDDVGTIRAVRLAGGEELATDVVLIGIGLVPNDRLALESGLAVDNGIVVDAYGRTSESQVFAIGDVARHPDTIFGGTRRLESVPNASEHARSVAAAIVHGVGKEQGIPWFWSDQYDLKLQSVGLPTGHDRTVVLGSIDEGHSVTVLYLKQGRLTAADAVGRARDFVAAKRLIAQGAVLTEDELADPDLDLKALAARRA